ncbi:major facilitator superfamily domain-containing protein [Pisolithus marmoratus]|nr:major facilitator superfamily domain-containing protein [Pisolithus marmoratus]
MLQTDFDGKVKGASPGEVDNSPERDTGAERRLRRKLDLRLVPVIAFLAMMNSIDRVAVTFARLKGLQLDLRLTDVQYDTVLAVVYASYCSALVPSNIYIGCCVILWGSISALTGLTKDYNTIITCRVLLGLFEAAYFPGSAYLLSSWYPRKELGLRAALLTAGGLAAYAFGSLWAAAVLGTMEGKLHIAAWRWLFFIEGIVTVTVGILSMWLLPDYPHNTRWLSVEEKRLAQLRLAKDVGEADVDSEEARWEWCTVHQYVFIAYRSASMLNGLRLAIKDAKVYLFMLLAFSVGLSSSFTNFFPTLTATLGYSTTVTFLLAALAPLFSDCDTKCTDCSPDSPPWILPTTVGVINAWHSDRTGERFFHLAIYWWISIVGFVISLSTMATAERYFSQYLMVLIYSGYMLLVTWVANAIPRPPGKRSVAIALTIGSGNVGTLVGSYMWKESWSPQYHPSFLTCLCSILGATALAFTIRTIQMWENKRMEHLEVEELEKDERERIEKAADLEGMTFDEAFSRRKRLPHIY